MSVLAESPPQPALETVLHNANASILETPTHKLLSFDVMTPGPTGIILPIRYTVVLDRVAAQALAKALARTTADGEGEGGFKSLTDIPLLEKRTETDGNSSEGVREGGGETKTPSIKNRKKK